VACAVRNTERAVRAWRVERRKAVIEHSLPGEAAEGRQQKRYERKTPSPDGAILNSYIPVDQRLLSNLPHR